MPKTIEVHVAWNDTSGELDRLTHVEFIDCEFMALETDVLDGEWIRFDEKEFTLHADENAWQWCTGGATFQFVSLREHVGNIMWDMLTMTIPEAAKFVHWLQSQKHWTLNVSAYGISKRFGQYTVAEFEELFEKEIGE